ncbi:MAG: ferrochelatase [Bacteroidales bacterium]
MKRAIILMNVGTPDAPTYRGVVRFLFSFLSDKRVITIPVFFRYLLVAVVIIPCRIFRVVKMYRRLWKGGDSPIRIITEELVRKLNGSSTNGIFYVAMSYGKPSIDSVLKQIKDKGLKKVDLLPLYPHYANSTTGVAINDFKLKIKQYGLRGNILYDRFSDKQAYKDFLLAQISKYTLAKYDHVLVLFHSLPLSQIIEECYKGEVHDKGTCYKCQCESTFEDVRQVLAGECNISSSMAYQSNMGKKWLQPFASDEIVRLAKEKSRLLLIAPSFYIDCLETLIEIDETYRYLFLQSGGREFAFVPAPNASPESVNLMLQLAGECGLELKY